MNKKIVIAAFLAFALILNVAAFEAYAFGAEKAKKCYKGLE